MTRTRELELGDRLLARIHAGPPPATTLPTLLQASTYTGAVEQIQIGANEHALIEHLDAVQSTTA